ncbi:MAG: hypothetical protein KGY50_04655 [Candidatus Thermoplasmatota archaeon]|nr:hypothetical protein [Candidatus Thermoplasmatota archaeon]
MNMKSNEFKLLVIGAVAILVFSFAYFFVFTEKPVEKKEEKIEEEVLIDDRISPYTNQGLVVQIKRIRNRGLLDKMITFGLNWKKKPTFYWVSTVDGKTHDSSNIASAGGEEGNGVFNTWDSFGEDSKANFYVEDEKETSQVTISIFEQEKVGLFGRRTQSIEVETIDLIYNFKTGRWTGDDSLKDDDGYGHVRRETYEIWFELYQSDSDHDKIPYWTEVNVLGTDPLVDDSKLDPDEDGIPTAWEWKWGYDPHSYDDHINLDPDIDGIENSEEYKMRKYYAAPFQQDMYLEIDGMHKGGLLECDFRDHVSYEETHQMLIERFAQHGINLYIDYGWPDGPINGGGELLEYMKVNDDTVGHHHNKFYQHHFSDDRKGIFRYCSIVVNAGFISPGDFNYYDHIMIDSGSKLMMKRLAFTEKYRKVLLAKGILHELGHSIGFMPCNFYGVDIQDGKQDVKWPTQLTKEEYDSYGEQYYSIMNYNYIFGPTKKQIRCFDYSDGSNGAPYDRNDWDYVYVPAFQTDQPGYEEAIPDIDETFEDVEIEEIDGDLFLKGWIYNETVTRLNEEKLPQLSFVPHVDCEYRVYVKQKETVNGNTNRIRVYARPNVAPTFAEFILIFEGKINKDLSIQLPDVTD